MLLMVKWEQNIIPGLDLFHANRNSLVYLGNKWLMDLNEHLISSLGGGSDLSTYSGVNISISNGWLLGTLQDGIAYEAMPKGIDKLSDCDVSKVEMWMIAGYPNN